MKLTLATKDDIFEVSEVTLKDRIIPCLCGVSYSGKEGCTEMMEPAIWFKVLIMDVLHIDCERRVVQWSSVRPPELDQCSSGDSSMTSSLPNVISLNEDCIDFVNSLEEVFDAIPGLLSLYRSGKLAKENFYKFLIQLLHVNVLPNVKLSCDNLDSVKLTIEKYNETLSELDDAIVKKTNMLLELKKAKQKERQRFASILNETKKPPHFEDLLVQILETDFKTDLKKISINTEYIPKQFLPASFDDESATVIKSALEKLSKMKNKPRLSWIYGSSVKGEHHQMQVMYLKMNETEVKMKASITKLLDNKMMLRSIVETMKTVVVELEEGLESFGVELNTNSFVDTTSFIGESLSTKSWVSLPKRMFNIFSDANHPIMQEHVVGTQKIDSIAKAIFEEQRLHFLKNSSLSLLDSKKKASTLLLEVAAKRKSKSCSNLTSAMADLVIFSNLAPPKNIDDVLSDKPSDLLRPVGLPPSDFVFVVDSSPDSISRSIERLKKMTFDHFDSVCKKIQTEIQETYVNTNVNKIWVIYENYFYEQTMDGLLKLYKLEYSGKIKVLTKSIDFFTLDDLDLSDSLMSKLLLSPFVDGLKQSTLSVASSIGKLSFNKLLEASQESFPQSSSDEDLCDSFKDGRYVGGKSSSVDNIDNHAPYSSDVDFLLSEGTKSSPVDSLESSCIESSSVRLKPCLLNRFAKFYQNIADALKAKTPKTKAHHLLRCLRNLTWQIEAIYEEIRKKKIHLCSDDIMDALILLLCNLNDPQALKDLYIQVQFLNQVLAQFFYNGEYHFALVQFVGVFQYLNDKAFMKKNRVTSNDR